ncbi:MAG: AAA family ATPase [Lachnospiraceae bacterium]|nr:AAA family ATPase [Lachnospiraceae bacterium]
MVIKKVCLENFGKFHNKVLEFSDGVNLLYGENEAGKTTIHTFIKAMLFGLDGRHGKSSESNEYEKYIPWDTPQNYKGSMVIEMKGEDYLIERNFLKSEKSYRITRLSDDKILDQHEMDEFFYGFDENCYYNTISISQLGSITNSDLEKVLRNYSSNLGSSKTTEIDVEAALNHLEDTKERLMEESGADRKESLEKEIAAIKQQIEELEKEEKIEIAAVEKSRESVGKLKTKVRALEVLDNVQTERQLKRNMDQESLMQRSDVLSEDLDKLKKDKEKSDKHMSELKELLDIHGVSTRDEVEREMENIMSKTNIPVTVLALIVVAFGIGVGCFIANPHIDFSDSSTWIKEMLCAFATLFFTLLFVIMYFMKKNNKTKKMLLMKELKISVDRYEAAKSESDYAQRQINIIEAELRSISYKLKEEEDKPEETSDYNSEIDDVSKQIQSKKEEKSQAQFKLEQKKESLLKARQQLERYELRLEKVDAIECDLQAIDEAMATIREISEEIRKSFGKEINEKASVYMNHITNGKYDNFQVDDEMNITIEGRGGRVIAVDRLSKGTVEQMYMALRLAAAEIIFEDDTKPILLDDAFVMYDNKRMGSTIKFMAEHLEQIIAFSCHTREKVMADKLGIEYKLVIID